jgi:membrane-bound lytic murein transglycosylase D
MMMRITGVFTFLLVCYILPVSGQYRDTSFVTGVNEADPFYSQNMLYKARLDSIQKTVPLPYNESVQKYINIYASRKDQIGKVLGLAGYYFPIFEKSLKEYDIPQEIKFLSVVESALNPHAVSRVGATGLWQFMYTTAKGYHLTMDNHIDERKDPVSSSRAAAAYFRDAFNELGDWLLAIAAYNCGKGAVSRAIQRSGGKTDFWEIRKFLPLETRNYVPAYIATTYIMNYYSKHDIHPVQPAFPTLTEMIQVTTSITMEGLAKATRTDLKDLLTLNPAFKKHRIYGSGASPQRLIIPAVQDNITYAAIYNLLNHVNEDEAAVSLASYTEPGSSAAHFIYHRVKKGETISGIASQYDVEAQDLKVWNNLRSFTIIPGQKLKVAVNTAPVKASTISYINYKVRPGDTLSQIAEKFNQTVSSIKAKNGLRSTVIRPGMILKLNKG